MKTTIFVSFLVTTVVWGPASVIVKAVAYAPQDGKTSNPPEGTPAGPVRVPRDVQAKAIIKSVRPEYPAAARSRRIQGKVVFSAVIGKDGKVKSLKAKSGPRELVQAAYDAVIRWEYRPTLLNGEPVEVVTDIEVNYTIL